MKLILVVDADPAVSQMLTDQLRFAGVEILNFPTFAEGLKMALDCRPELVLTAAAPPGWEGFTLAQQLRDQAPEVPVILLSPSPEPWVAETARSLKVRALLRLPVTAETLLPAVCEVLGLPAPSRDQLASVPIPGTSAPAPSPPPPPATLPPPPPPPSPPPAVPAVGAARPTAPVSAPSGAGGPAQPGPTPRFSTPAKILIVEDDRNIAKALAIRLRAAGLEVIMAYDALSGLDMALRQQPDLVILDIGLPAGSGLSVAERIQNLIPKLTPIIFITASRQPGLRERALQLGPVDYIEKPYDAEKLLEAIARVLPAKG
jgi:DNA-binding response OmpR family regulator